MLHRFEPTHFYNSFGPHPPAFEIGDGDTLLTWTLDARGKDAQGHQRAQRGNPLTGPIYVRGAALGDTLEVTLEEIRPNRRYGFCGRYVAPHTVNPFYVPHLPITEDLAEWDVDAAQGVARLTSPEGHLAEKIWPLDPMLGCIGVAPPYRQAIASSTSGTYGGNMDYRGLRAGAVVYFPVYEPGALLFIGDGHALQGDGELVGMGIEISMDVRLTVRVLKGKHIGWPRGQDAEFLFTLGNARPLEEALQYATTEMLHWLQGDYGLSPVEASILLGQCGRYEIGNVFDPAYTIACKVAKRDLPHG